MLTEYVDIMERIPEEPKWFDEHGVPRFCDFVPHRSADIYAQEVVLLAVRCQSCARPFKVAMSWSAMDAAYGRRRFSEHVSDLHYGDPPNVSCCPAGPTMNSEPERVLEFWRSESGRGYVRVPELEVSIDEED